jgi:hypothetical protein
MADAMDQAAKAFDADAGKTSFTRSPSKSSAQPQEGPRESLFENVGNLDPDTEPKGGGDDDPTPEELIYGKSSAGTRTPGKKGEKDRSDDGADGDSGEDSDADAADGDDEGSGESDDEASDDPDNEDAEGEGSEGEAALLARKVEVTVDGEPVEVSLKEALEGYVRTETFHRRMNQLDEAKKIVRRAAADAVHNYEYSINIAKEMEAHMETMIPKEPNWDEEFKKDPVQARELQRYYEKATAFRQQLRQQMAETKKKQQDADHAQLAAFAQEESTKFEQANRKYWSDPKKKAKDLDSMRRTGLASGFTDEELSQVYDSRMLTVLLKASKYDRMMANKPKPVVRPQAKPIPPGAGSVKQRTAQKGVSSAMKRLNRTGSMDDAAVVFDQIIARG